MKLECSIEKIKNALMIVDRITGKNLTLPVLGSVLWVATGKTLKLRATNLNIGIEMEVPAKIEKEGVIAALEGMKIRKDQSDLLKTTNLPVQFILGLKDSKAPAARRNPSRRSGVSMRCRKNLISRSPCRGFWAIPSACGTGSRCRIGRWWPA